MKKNIRITKPTTPAFTREDVDMAVTRIKTLVIERRRLETDRNARVAAIEQEFMPLFAPIDERLGTMTGQVQAWAEAHPEEFKERKSIAFASGLVGFRTGTPKVALLTRKWTWGLALGAVRRVLSGYIRTTEEIDRDAIIAGRNEAVLKQFLPECGLKIVQEEKFFIDPNLKEAEARQAGVIG